MSRIKFIDEWECEVIDCLDTKVEGFQNAVKIILRTPPDQRICDILLNGKPHTVSLICFEGHEDSSGIWRVIKIVEESSMICVPTNQDGEIFKNDSSKPAYLHRVENDGEYHLHIKKKYPSDIKLVPKVFIAPPLIFHTRITIFSINEIDTITQSFNSEFLVELRLKSVIDFENIEVVSSLLSCYQYNDDFINFLNIREVTDDKQIWRKLEYIEDKKNYDFVIQIRQRSIIEERMELEDFPFDIQDLNYTFCWYASRNRIRLKINNETPSLFQVTNFQLSAIFNVLYQDVVLAKVLKSDLSESTEGLIYDKIQFRVFVSRDSGFYLSNVIAPMAVLTFLSPSSCFVDEDGSSLSMGDRLDVILALLLTAVAYKFVVADSLPKISYMTFLDHYILLCFGLMCITVVENIMHVGFTAAFETSKQNEWFFVVGFYISYFILNGGLFFYVMRVKRKQKEWHKAVLELERFRRDINYYKNNKKNCDNKQLTILRFVEDSPESERLVLLKYLRMRGLFTMFILKNDY